MTDVERSAAQLPRWRRVERIMVAERMKIERFRIDFDARPVRCMVTVGGVEGHGSEMIDAVENALARLF